MTFTTETFVSVSEQRAIEKAAKAAAIAKKKAAVLQAMKNGLSGETEVFSKLVKGEWVQAAGHAIALNTATSILKGHSEKKISDVVKKDLIPFLTVSNKEGTAYPVANQAAKVMFQCLLDVAFTIDGEQVSGLKNTVETQIVQELYRAVGNAIELELSLTALAETHPRSYYSLLSVLKNPAYSQDAKDVAKEIALRGLDTFSVLSDWMKDPLAFVMPEAVAAPPHVWGEEEKATIGAFLLSQVTSVVPEEQRFWVSTIHTVDGNPARYITLSPSLDPEAIASDLAARVRAYGPSHQLNSWEEVEYGGPIANEETHDYPFIRGRNHESVASDLVKQCVDTIQSVRYVVNPFTLEAAQSISTEKIQVGKFISPKGHHYTKSMRTKRALLAAAEWLGHSFVSAWNVDYRGRMYPISSILTIQSTDFEKSLLKFAVQRPITDATAWWLAVHVANTFGHEKLALQDRVEWVYAPETQEYISAVAADPVFYLKAWASGELEIPAEPWQFLAACEEFAAIYISKTRDYTNLPVAVDASCSGIQVLSGVMKDADAAALVNVVPSEVRQDAYGAVASIVQEALQQPYVMKKKVSDPSTGKSKTEKITFDLSAYAPLITRSVVKKVVMTLAYNASARSHGEYIVESLKGSIDAIAESDRQALYSAVGILSRAAMERLLPGVIAMKKWLADAAFAVAPQKKVISFTTPSGFVMGQKKNFVETIRLQCPIAGIAKDVFLAVGQTDEVDIGRNRTCTMPNIVHALDASLLHMAFANFEYPVALIHDSVLTTATDMQAAVDAYRASYVEHFADGSVYQQLEGFFGVEGMPAQGDLDVSVVMDSDFFLA